MKTPATNQSKNYTSRLLHHPLCPTTLAALLMLVVLTVAPPAYANSISVSCDQFNVALVEGRTRQIDCTITSNVYGTAQPTITALSADAQQQDPPEEDKIKVGGTNTAQGPLPITGTCTDHKFKKGGDTCGAHITLVTDDIDPKGPGDPDNNDNSRWKIVFQAQDDQDARNHKDPFRKDWDVTVNDQPTPEPSTLLLLGSGVLGAGGVLRKRLLTRS